MYLLFFYWFALCVGNVYFFYFSSGNDVEGRRLETSLLFVIWLRSECSVYLERWRRFDARFSPLFAPPLIAFLRPSRPGTCSQEEHRISARYLRLPTSKAGLISTHGKRITHRRENVVLGQRLEIVGTS